jgi:glyoxalase/bleomycin resistance protein/dioxygenase superfamily protein
MFKELIQVGFVSKEISRILDSYINIYNIGPWYLLKFCPENVGSMRVYGKKQEYAMNVAACPIGDVRFEYIEPLTESIFSDFYNIYKDDIIHHLKFGVKDYEKTLNYFKKKNIDLIQVGHQLGDTGKNIFNFFDTKRELGFVTEIVNVTKGFIKPKPDLWIGSELKDYDPVFTRPSVIGLVVKDLEEKIKEYMKFDIGPWEIHNFGLKDDLNFEAKMAFCRLGNVILKLIEPGSDSIFSQDLSKYGEGIHHIKMEVENYEEKLDYLQSKGAEIICSGKYLDEINFSFLNTRKHLNFCVQISDKEINNKESESGIIIHP